MSDTKGTVADVPYLPVVQSIHADIAFTLGEYLYKKFKPNAKTVEMNVANLEVLKGLVAQKNTKAPQLIQVSAATADIHSGIVDLKWYSVRSDGTVDDPFASANIHYGDAALWLANWVPTTHLILGRIQTLSHLASEGIATKFSHSMAYRLFATNLVDYASKYRGMQSVVLHEFEAFADILLSTEKSGTWTIPPYLIDSVAHLAGFIMNVSDAVDTTASFCVTPGWGSMRFARPLVPGDNYRSYVKMIATVEDPTVYLGDVYILQDDVIIGMVGGIKFRRYPRVLLNRFFSAPGEDAASKHHAAAAAAPSSKPASAQSKAAPQAAAAAVTLAGPVTTHELVKAHEAPAAPVPVPVSTISTSASTATRALTLIAHEAAFEDPSDLQDSASFAQLGVDSLMSLVIAEKFREELGVTVGGSLFLDYPTVGDLRMWLMEKYG